MASVISLKLLTTGTNVTTVLCAQGKKVASVISLKLSTTGTNVTTVLCALGKKLNLG